MAGSLTFLVGGARAGKSTIALQIAHASGRPVTFLATAQALDDEMARRIAVHRAERPHHWTTIEEPDYLTQALSGIDDQDFVIVDCLTLWVANRVFAGVAPDVVAVECRDFAERARAHRGGVVIVSNEVGLGIVPDNALSREYRDLLGRVNATVASAAADVYFVVAGRTLRLESFPMGSRL